MSLFVFWFSNLAVYNYLWVSTDPTCSPKINSFLGVVLLLGLSHILNYYLMCGLSKGTALTRGAETLALSLLKEKKSVSSGRTVTFFSFPFFSFFIP